MEENSFTIINKEGKEVICDVISMITDKDARVYLLYTDYFLDDDGNFRILASELVTENNEYVLKEIEDEQKLKEIINATKDSYAKQIKED